MLSKLEALEALKSKNKESKGKLDDIMNTYKFLYITDQLDLTESTLNQNLTNSNVIMINYYENQPEKSDELHLIIAFRKTVLIVEQLLLKNLQPLFLNKNKLKICFFKNTKNIFDEKINIKYEESTKNEFFDKQITKISQEFFNNKTENNEFNRFLNNIKSCISGYLI